MTVSFHEFGDSFFPGSGNIDSIGDGEGRYFSLNVPLKPGMNDDTFEPLFQRVMGKVMEVYQPGCVVLQSGADSLSNDKLGHFNLSTKGHASCLKFM
jgi:histone deacetylase 1/2